MSYYVDPNGRAAVYRLYDADGVLLYVGSGFKPTSRLWCHRRTKPWWPSVKTKTITWYETRVAALAEEERAIHLEYPRFNEQRYPYTSRPKHLYRYEGLPICGPRRNAPGVCDWKVMDDPTPR